MTTNRDALIAKIRALLSKTVDNGCTEAEALTALERARAMIDAHEISDDELKLAQDETAEVLDTGRSDVRGVYRGLANAVARFCGCKAWTIGPRRGAKCIVFCGLPSDAQFADWLLEALATFVRSELAAHLLERRPTQRDRIRVMNGFVIGCTRRISARLNDLAAQSEELATGNGRSLVLAKDAAIRGVMDQIEIGAGRASVRRAEGEAFKAGHAAGDKASFGRPVSGAGAVLRIASQQGA